MADVAREAGVSIASVSYALNDQPGVSAASRVRILAEAERLGFSTDRLARGLRRGATQLIGLLVPDIANPFYPEIAAGVIDAASASGYQVLICQVGLNATHQEAEANKLLDLRVDGLIFTGLVGSDRPLVTRLLNRGVPLVQAVRRLPRLTADHVGIDDRAAGAELASYLLELGHRDITVFTGPSASSASRGRLAGYRAAFEERQLSLPAERILHLDLTYAAGYEAAGRVFDSGRRLPTAIIAGNDVMATGVIDAVLDHGRLVPEEVSVVGYDDMSFSGSRLLGLTTVHQPRHELGVTAVELLLSRLESPDLRARTVLLPHHLKIRSSSAAPAQPRRTGGRGRLSSVPVASAPAEGDRLDGQRPAGRVPIASAGPDPAFQERK